MNQEEGAAHAVISLRWRVKVITDFASFIPIIDPPRMQFPVIFVSSDQRPQISNGQKFFELDNFILASIILFSFLFSSMI